MSKQDLIDMLNYLIDQIVFASDCLLAYNSIYLCSQKYNYAMNQAPGFFIVVSHSLRYLCVCSGRQHNRARTVCAPPAPIPSRPV